MPHSLVLISPIEYKQTLEDLGVALGHTNKEYSIALSETGVAPATHVGLRTWASDQTKLFFHALKAGAINVPVPGYTQEQVSAALSAVLDYWADDAPGVGAQHFIDMLNLNNLKLVEPGEV